MNIPLSDNGFWIILQFAVRGGAMFHIGMSEKSGTKSIMDINISLKLRHS